MYNTKYLFIDTEFTGEHALTTLVSLALVGEDDESLYVTLTDYDVTQVSGWLTDNVLSKIDFSKSICSADAYKLVAKWMHDYAQGKEISLVSFGLGPDQILLYELWKYADIETPYHSLHCLPKYLNHSKHIDLRSLFMVGGYDPDLNREEFIGYSVKGHRHEAVYDAYVAKACFKKLVNNIPELHRLLR